MNDLQFMPHQDEVLNLTDDKNRCAYYLDMGLGKTFVGAEKMYLLNNTVNLIVYPADIRAGVLELLKWDIKNRPKTGVKSETLSRYSAKIYDLENLRKAHQHAKKGKGWYKEVQEIDKEPDKYLKQIQEMLINHTYKTSDYEVFYKQDGKKLRKIYKLPYFPDRICQWAILQVIEPCIINNLTADTYSAIPNRGIHKGLTKLQTAMWNDPEECKYCLKLDARHYYQSINHDLLNPDH